MIARDRNSFIPPRKWVLVFILGITIGWSASESLMFFMPEYRTDLLFLYPVTTNNSNSMDAPIVDKMKEEELPSRPPQFCPYPNHTYCSIQRDRPCPLQHYMNTVSYLSGAMSTVNESNLDTNQLQSFCQEHFTSYGNAPSARSATCKRTIENHIWQFPTSTHNPMVLLPGWGASFPGKRRTGNWKKYTTGILVNKTVCFWPVVPPLADSEHDLTLWTAHGKNVGVPTHYKKVMISEGYFENVWHASVILNTWCMMREDEDLHFAVQYQSRRPPSYVENWGVLLGIERKRIITQELRPIVVEEMLLAAQFHDRDVDWSCLHRVLRLPFDPETESYAMLYVRSHKGPHRDISANITSALEYELSKEIPDLKVKKFYGTEPLEELQRLFANAKIVIGPHGAGLLNTVFCQDRTPVVEFVTPGLLNRPWLMYGGHSFLLPWWPVLLDSFGSRSQILNAVTVVKKALLEQAQVP